MTTTHDFTYYAVIDGEFTKLNRTTVIKVYNTDDIFVGEADINVFAWADSEDECINKMREAVKVYGAATSLINAINFFKPTT
jgi:hypothetical protein